MSSTSDSYKQAWTRERTLDELNTGIHDGVKDVTKLLDRARKYRERLITNTYPIATPPEGGRMMELGSGVGWIMEAMLEAFPIGEIIGLDISEVMIRAAQQRLQDPRARWVHYEGFVFPFEDSYFDNMYSAAAIQHINKDVAFLLFKEIHRCLKPGGHATLHFLSYDHALTKDRDYAAQCRRHIEGSKLHHLYLYSAEELLVLFSDVIGVSDFDVKRIGTSLYVHFSKGSDNKFLDPKCEERIRFRNKA